MKTNKNDKMLNPLYLISFLLMFVSSAWCQTISENRLAELLATADSVAKTEDSVRSGTTYRYRLFTAMNWLKSDGSFKSADTTIAIITQKGDKEISREIVYTTKSGEGKKEEKELSFSFDDPAYNFSLTDSSGASYKIAVVPKSSPPKEGEYKGAIEFDKQRYFIRRMDLQVPDPEGALKEFAVEMDFELLEGGFAVPVGMRMRGFVKALMGIIKVRFTGQFKFSDYQILD